MHTTLPSGMIIDLRGLKGRDFRYLANEENVQNDEVEDFVLTNCTTGLVDPGPYVNVFAGGSVEWSKVLAGDGAYAFLAVRERCYPGKPYVFSIKCANRNCGLSKRGFEWEIPIGELLAQKVKPLADADREVFMAGNRFEARIPDGGPPFSFKLKTRADSKKFAALLKQVKQSGKEKKKQFNMAMSAMAFSILAIEGHDGATFPQRVAVLEELELAQIDQLMAMMESHDCGIETGIDVECPDCGDSREVQLPFERTLLLPESTSRRKNTEEKKLDAMLAGIDDDQELAAPATS
jgi:hypothetical protein